MIAYKGFNGDLTCTKGKGKYQYEVGKTYREDEAKCAKNGFHCVEEPIEVLNWYQEPGDRYCMVKASGDINEDGDDKISCTEMTILRELTLQQIGILECQWLKDNPRRTNSDKVKKESGYAKENGIVVVRGKNPKAAGQIGATIYLLKEAKRTSEIEEIGVFQIDGQEYRTDVYYRVDGRQCRCEKKS